MRALLGNPEQVVRGYEQRTQLPERALRARMSLELTHTLRDAAKQVAAGAEVPLLDGHEDRVEALLRGTYAAMSEVFGRWVFDAAGKSRKDANRSIFERLVQTWILRVGAAKVKDISETTRKQIQRSLASSRGEGLGTAAQARRLRQDVGQLNAARSLVIARTEVHTAAQGSQLFAAEALGLPKLYREWITVEDERAREDHVNANGQVVGMKEDFNVGGAVLRFPGDPDGPAEQTINCRCVVGLLLED